MTSVFVPHVPKPGDTIIITHDRIDTRGTVLTVCDGGRKVDVELANGARLRVAVTLLSLPPAHHRHRTGDMDTAVQAAHAATDTLTHTQLIVLQALAAAGDRGMLDHDHQPINGLGQDTAGKRRGELCDMGYAADTGIRRRTPRGRNAAVWTITPTGLAVLAQHKGAA